MTAATQVLRLADGRTLAYAVYGDPSGSPLLLLHGTPGCHSQIAIGDAAGKQKGLAIVAPDRWGYGLSGVPGAPSLPGFAVDMAALMDHLGYDRFAVGGISGGGPYAVAVASACACRVTALALISPMGPIVDPSVRRSLRLFHRFCFTVLPHWPVAVRAIFRVFRTSIEHAPRLAAQLATLRSGRRDKALIAQPAIAGWLLGSFRDGLRRGTVGPLEDLQTFSRDWDVDCSAIRAPARLWIGTEDSAVPLQAARFLGRSVPGCRITELPAEGHLWVATRYGDVLDWIVATMGEAHTGAADPLPPNRA